MTKNKIIIASLLIVVLIVGGLLGLKIYGAKKAEERFNKFINEYNLDEIYEIKAGGFDYNPFSREIIIKDIYIKPKVSNYAEKFNTNSSLKADALRVRFDRFEDGFNLKLVFENLLLQENDLKNKVKESTIIVKLKDDNLTLSYEIENDKYLDLKLKAHLDKFDKSIISMISDSLKNINSISTANISNSFILVISKLSQIVLKEFEIEYEEKGFINYVIESIAREKKSSPEQVKKKILDEISYSLNKENNPKIKKFLIALKYMIENQKGKLEIKLKNKENLSIQDLIYMYSYLGSTEFEKLISKKFDIEIEFEK